MDLSDKRIQAIFQAYYPHLTQLRLPLKAIKAVDAITHCRTPAMGVSYFSCADQHTRIEQHHSCHHRSCYLCASKARHDWVEAQRSKLFNTPHFHVIFTLPHEYLNLWRYNEAWFSRCLFRASTETLMELMGDVRYHGVTPGIMTALHTWGRQLTLHPHTHCLVTAGGLNRAGQWQAIEDFLLPVRVLKALYRGKVQAFIRTAFEAGELRLPPDMDNRAFFSLHQAAFKKTWAVRIEERYEHGKGVLLYLARYFKGGPLKPEQILSADHRGITFRYLDHRDQRKKLLRLSPLDFLQRFLQHVPAQGMHTVRHYGLYASSSKNRRDYCKNLLGHLPQTDQARLTVRDMILFCPVCGSHAHRSHSLWRGWHKGISLIRYRSGGLVQQDDETNLAMRSRVPDSG